MEKIELALTDAELQDIRMAVAFKWSDIRNDQDQYFVECAARLDALMNKLARASVNGHA